jgi:hypothetical protein
MWRWLKNLFAQPNIICVAGDRSCDLVFPSECARAVANYRRTDDLMDRFEAVVGREELDLWLDRPVADWGGRTPIDLLCDNDFEPIERIVYQLESGIPG